MTFPIVLLYRFITIRRKIYVGLEVQHSIALDIVRELRVVDVSRLDDGFVGIQSRERISHTSDNAPPHSDDVEYWSTKEFWFGRSSSD